MDIFSKLRGMKILLVDDDEWIRDSLSLYFEAEGCHLQALETAEEGINVLKGQTYDIIITDYKLPGLDGLEFLKRIQKTHSDAIKILITAYGNAETIAAAQRIGVQDFIRKPFSSDTILASLSRLIETHEGMRDIPRA